MADGSCSDALSKSSPSASGESSGKPRKCSACQTPLKDHLGLHGPSKCFVGAFAALTDRVAELERCVAKSEDDLRDHEALAVKRQEALLATIATLEERIDRLEELRCDCPWHCDNARTANIEPTFGHNESAPICPTRECALADGPLSGDAAVSAFQGSDSKISGAAACSSPLVIHDEGKEDVESLAKAAHGLSGGQDTDIVSERSHAANGMPTCDNDALRAPVPTFADKAAAPPQLPLTMTTPGSWR